MLCYFEPEVDMLAEWFRQGSCQPGWLAWAVLSAFAPKCPDMAIYCGFVRR